MTVPPLALESLTATNVTGSGSTRTWQFPTPNPGTVTFTWAADHTITDSALNRFNETGSTWSYFFEPTDLTPPSISAVSPAAGSAVANLTSVTVTFTEPVAPIEAVDLLVNGVPASGATLVGDRTVSFTYSVSPVANQGPQVLSIPAGAVTRREHGDPVQAHTASFWYDAAGLD